MRSSLSNPGLLPTQAPGLMRLASRLAGASDAEDLVQSTWLRTLEHGEPVEAPRSWLRRVLVNEQRMQLRGRLRRDERERAQRDLQPNPTSVEDVVHCLEVTRIIDGLIDELDEEVRLVVRERYFGGDSAAEIARRHRIPAGTVRWRLKSGLDRLRSQLDARYGGRRALWAGGFVPSTMAPTLGSSAASQASTASGTLSAAAKGPSAMSLKILLAAGLTATAGGVAWVASTDTTPEPAAASPEPVAAALVAEASPPPPPLAVAPSETQPQDTRAQWAARLSKIQAAQAQIPPERVQAPSPAHHEGMNWHAADGGGVEIPAHGQHHFCPEGEECPMDATTQEILGLVHACKDFMSHAEPALTLTAHVIGEPGVGTIVESVELSGDGVPEPLEECLTETMYTLDLGPAEESFERDIEVMLAGASAVDLEQLAAAGLDEATLAKVEQAVAEHGDAHAMFIGDGE